MSYTVLSSVKINGSLEENVPLAPFSWFKVGGAAECFFRPADPQDLALMLQSLPHNMPIMVMGASSNMLIRDGGVRGLVIRLGRGFSQMTRLNETDVYIGAAVPDMNAARFLMQEALEGGAFLRGIPGTIGGALKMNAGAYGRELKDIFIEAYGVTYSGEQVTLSPQDMQFAYRYSGIKDVIFTGVKLRLKPSDAQKIKIQMDEITNKRQETQPVKSNTGGSTFKNPDGHKAWSLIDQAGCRGLRIGDAEISLLHCNFMINHGNASAYDLELLGETVRQKVFQKSQIMLDWEIKRVGDFKTEAEKQSIFSHNKNIS